MSNPNPPHASRTLGLSPTNLHRSGCCKISSRPEGAAAFLIVSERHFSSELKPDTAGAYLPPVLRAADLNIATSPPITIAVFDKKTDLRI